MMVKTGPIVLALFVALLCHTPAAAQTQAHDRSNETAHLKGEAKEVADWLIAVQRAGWEAHDFETYARQWSDDAELTWARSAEAGPFDYTINVKQLLATRKIMMGIDPLDTRISLKEIVVLLNDDIANVEWRIMVETNEGVYNTLTAEQYQLMKTDKGWQVQKNRAWVLEIIQDGDPVKMTDKEWARRDKIAAQAKTSGDMRGLRFALLDAYRFGEAHDAAVIVTKQKNANAEDWAIRGWLAGIACKNKDMLPSFKKARSIDSDIFIPEYAEAALNQ